MLTVGSDVQVTAPPGARYWAFCLFRWWYSGQSPPADRDVDPALLTYERPAWRRGRSAMFVFAGDLHARIRSVLDIAPAALTVL